MKSIYDCVVLAMKLYKVEAIHGTIGNYYGGAASFACVIVLDISPDRAREKRFWANNETELWKLIKRNKQKWDKIEGKWKLKSHQQLRRILKEN